MQGQTEAERLFSEDDRYLLGLAIRLAGIIFILFLLYSAIDVWQEYQRRQEELAASIRQAVEGVRIPMRSFDYETVRELAKQLNNREDVLHVRVMDSFEFVVYETLGQAGPGNITVYELGGDISSSRVAEITVVTERTNIWLLAATSIAFAFASAFIAIIPASVLIYYYLAAYIRRPMLALDTAIEETLSSGRNVPIHYDAEHAFGSIVRNFNKMQHSLNSAGSAKQEALASARTALTERNASIEAMDALLSSLRQTVIILDGEGQLLGSKISAPFQKNSLNTLRNIVMAEDPILRIDELPGVEHIRVIVQHPERLSFEFTLKGENIIQAEHFTFHGNHALVMRDVTRATTNESILDNVLEASNIGLLFLDNTGRIHDHRGTGFGELLEAVSRSGHSTGSDDETKLMKHPDIAELVNSPGSECSITLDNNAYQLRSVRLPSGLICLVHANVTVARELERKLNQDSNLRQIGEIASGVAHDFNNILGLIIGNLELVKDDVGEEHKRLLAESLEAGERGAGIVNSLLTYVGNNADEPVLSEIDKIIKSSLSLFKKSVGPNVQIDIDLASNGYARIDRSIFLSSLLNLVINAGHAMNGIGRIKIETRSIMQNAGKRAIEISISDTGPGVPDELRERIFSPFFTTKGPGAGSGLGLAMVQGFVTKSNGSISVRNGDEGAIFTITLPEMEISARPHKIEKEAPQKEHQSIAPASVDMAARILLVEDEPNLLNTVSRVLETLGCKVSPALNASEGLDILQKNKVDLIISDMNMPEMNGLQFAQSTRKLGIDAPLILYSGDITSQEIEVGKDLGIDLFLQKPVSRARFQEAMTNLLKPQSVTHH